MGILNNLKKSHEKKLAWAKADLRKKENANGVRKEYAKESEAWAAAYAAAGICLALSFGMNPFCYMMLAAAGAGNLITDAVISGEVFAAGSTLPRTICVEANNNDCDRDTNWCRNGGDCPLGSVCSAPINQDFACRIGPNQHAHKNQWCETDSQCPEGVPCSHQEHGKGWQCTKGMQTCIVADKDKCPVVNYGCERDEDCLNHEKGVFCENWVTFQPNICRQPPGVRDRPDGDYCGDSKNREDVKKNSLQCKTGMCTDGNCGHGPCAWYNLGGCFWSAIPYIIAAFVIYILVKFGPSIINAWSANKTAAAAETMAKVTKASAPSVAAAFGRAGKNLY